MLLLVRKFRSSITNVGIYRSLAKEEEKIRSMHDRALGVRVANKTVDAGELVSSCREIKDALDTFYVSCSCFFKLRFHIDSLQVGLTLLVERNTRNILKVCLLTSSHL